MHRKWNMVVLITIAVAALSCSQPETEQPQTDDPAAPVETGADPTVVDADHYNVEFENDLVRLVRITYGPGDESIMHHHPDSVAVFLTDHDVEFEAPDGSTVEAHVEAGQHAFSPAGLHLPRNIGDEPLDLVLVEVK